MSDEPCGGALAAHLQALLQAEGGLAALLLALLRGAGALGLRWPLQATHIVLRRALGRPLHCSTAPPAVGLFADPANSSMLCRRQHVCKARQRFLSW